MIPAITIFYYIFDQSIIKDEKLDSIDKEADNAIKNCIVNNYTVTNFQDRRFT